MQQTPASAQGSPPRSNTNSPCAAVAYMQNVQGSPMTAVIRNPVQRGEPIYGDPTSFYNTTNPEIRRNRRFM